MLEYIVLISGAVVSVAMMMRQKQVRLEPLKNSEKVAVEINTPTALEALIIHLPPPHFLKNMSAAVDTERNELASRWSYEKNLFPVLWRKMPIPYRKQLISKLLEELVYTIGLYSNSDRLLTVLCPKLTTESLLARDVYADASTSEKEASTEVFKFILAAQDKLEIKSYCLPLLVVSTTRVDGDVDPNVETKEDKVLEEHVEVFLRALQHLCAIKFAKQLLVRYKSDPWQSIVTKASKKVGPLLLLGLLAALLAYLLDRFGLVKIFMVGYKSPFDN
jgi:hypothetical protein